MLGIVRNTKLSVLSATVSKNRVPVEEMCAHLLTPKQAQRMAKGTGFKRLSVTPDLEVCTSDLCFTSANEIFERGLARREEIGAIIFLTQSPDYELPATAYCLQDRLHLPNDVIAFDINLGCSGFVYGVYTASMFLSNMERKVLFCCGDTSSHANWKGDTSMISLFGDAGIAAVIERAPVEEDRKIFYNINSWGSGAKCLYKPRGGHRANKITDVDGNLIQTIRENFTVMDGMGIMDFSLKETPENIEALIDYAQLDKADIDIALFHQANRMIVGALADRLGLDSTKVPFNCQDIGNTSSASIPVCMTELAKGGDDFNAYKTALLSGFGVGLSVASVIMDLSGTKVLETLEYE